MRILVVGSGGREHALAWRLAQSPGVKGLLACPGNPGLESLATCFPAPREISGYADLAQAEHADLTLVGPEAPLVSGIVDEFRSRGLKIIGPTRAAAQLEGSKIFAKQFFQSAGIPTARTSSKFSDFSFPVVIKADGLAAGKGVVIAHNHSEAEAALAHLGAAVVIEEFLEGEEVSFIGLSDGRTVLPFPPTQDHKRALDNDNGPNTGGMGAYLDGNILSAAQESDIMERIMLPAISRMNRQGMPFTGFLYAGLMMTPDGPKVLEFNVRLGDPETQVLMHAFDGDLAEILAAVAAGDNNIPIPRPRDTSVCVVMAAQNYPGTPALSDPISGLPEAEALGVTVFQAGTKRAGDRLVTSGGRVLGVTASGHALPAAISSVYRAVEKIHFRGMHYRHDIGRKGLKRC